MVVFPFHVHNRTKGRRTTQIPSNAFSRQRSASCTPCSIGPCRGAKFCACRNFCVTCCAFELAFFSYLFSLRLVLTAYIASFAHIKSAMKIKREAKMLHSDFVALQGACGALFLAKGVTHPAMLHKTGIFRESGNINATIRTQQAFEVKTIFLKSLEFVCFFLKNCGRWINDT